MSLLGNIFVSSCFFFFFSCCIREKNFLDVKENENMGGGGLKGNRLQQKWGEEKDSLIEISAKNEAKLNWLWSFCAGKWNEDNQVILWDGESELETETKPESVLERVCVSASVRVWERVRVRVRERESQKNLKNQNGVSELFLNSIFEHCSELLQRSRSYR